VEEKMTSRNALLNKIDTLPPEYWGEIADFVEYLSQKRLKKIPETMLLSEATLAKEWDTPEEDKAWANL
jgi:hypothetical protein